ncbi:MAG: dTDP-4-dehydrorhamnose 3,5-epimerase family protein [Actinomycetota bacterium]
MAKPRASERIAGVWIVELEAFGDERGRFLETYRREWIPEAREMIQGNRSDSKEGVLRGLHYHLKQADYWYVPSGTALVALADLRRSSPTRGAFEAIEAGESAPLGVYIPPGVAHGFLALTDMTLNYLVDEYYDGADERGLAWDDPEIGFPWPRTDPILSDRDRSNPRLAEIPERELPP